jgi:hypothetical protein
VKKFQPVKRPGAATAKAKKEGIPLSKWKQEHKHDSGLSGQEARFAINAKHWHHGKTDEKHTPHSAIGEH